MLSLDKRFTVLSTHLVKAWPIVICSSTTTAMQVPEDSVLHIPATCFLTCTPPDEPMLGILPLYQALTSLPLHPHLAFPCMITPVSLRGKPQSFRSPDWNPFIESPQTRDRGAHEWIHENPIQSTSPPGD